MSAKAQGRPSPGQGNRRLAVSPENRVRPTARSAKSRSSRRRRGMLNPRGGFGVDRASLKRSWPHGSHIFPHRVAGPSSTGISRRRGGAWPTTTFPIRLLTLQASIDLSEPQRCHPAGVGSAVASIHVDVVLAASFHLAWIIIAFQRSNAPSCAARALRASMRPRIMCARARSSRSGLARGRYKERTRDVQERYTGRPFRTSQTPVATRCSTSAECDTSRA